MISPDEAIKIIKENTETLEPVKVPLHMAAGKVLAKDVYSATDVPGFPQSSMDGYAFLFSDWMKNKPLKIEGEIPAGSGEKNFLKPGQAIRIFTGAPVPESADTVVMQEKTSIKFSPGSKNELIIKDDSLTKGANLRSKGSEIKLGDLALKKFTFLSPAAMGFLAGIGIAEIDVFPNPSVSIIITGKELQKIGNPLAYGQVYESNSFTLTSALQQVHIDLVKILRVDDDQEIVTETLKNALQDSDMVLLSGGISVGDYDFVLQASKNCGVRKLFHKIKQRPGKPLFFGKKGNKLVFGLPGNPSSVLTCFYEYVLAALEVLTMRNVSLKVIRAPLLKSYQKSVLLTHFLKGKYDGKTVEILGAQESFRLSSYAKANCLVKIDEEVMECKSGELVDVHLFPR